MKDGIWTVIIPANEAVLHCVVFGHEWKYSLIDLVRVRHCSTCKMVQMYDLKQRLNEILKRYTI